MKLRTEIDWYGACALRLEKPGRSLGELVHPGALIQAGPEHTPYFVERITRQEHAWDLTGWYAPKGIVEQNEAQRWWLNGWVAQPYQAAPLGILLRPIEMFDYDCPGRDSCFMVLAVRAFASRRSGQLQMF